MPQFFSVRKLHPLQSKPDMRLAQLDLFWLLLPILLAQLQAAYFQRLYVFGNRRVGWRELHCAFYLIVCGFLVQADRLFHFQHGGGITLTPDCITTARSLDKVLAFEGLALIRKDTGNCLRTITSSKTLNVALLSCEKPIWQCLFD